MDLSNRLCLAVAGLLCLPLATAAQTISLEQLLDAMRRSHPAILKEQLTPKIEREGQNTLLGTQDWIVFSSVSILHEEPAIAFSGPLRTNALAVSGGVEKAFWNTGARLSATCSSVRADIKLDPAFSAFGFPSAFYQNELAITYAHPILKNRNGMLDRLQFNLTQFDIDFAEIQSAENQEKFLAGIALKFLDWVFLTEQKEILGDRFQLSQTELARIEKKRAANLVDKVDVIRAENALRVARQNVVLAEAQWRAVRTELAVLAQNDELTHSRPQFDLYALQKFDSLETAKARLQQNSLILATLTVRMDQLKMAQRGNEEQLKPDLSLIAQLNTKKLHGSFSNSLAMNKPDAFVGVQFRMPLGNQTARAGIQKTERQIEQLQTRIRETELSLAAALGRLHVQLEEYEKVLELNSQQIQSAKERTRNELRLHNQGRGDFTFVIQSQDSEQHARLTYARNALSYQKLYIHYLDLMDQLVK